MKTLYKPSTEELDTLKEQALVDGKTPETWTTKMADTLATILTRDPKQYRSYGPYWWIVKKELIANGHEDFGTFLDAEWVKQADYGNSFYNLLAAYLYRKMECDMGLIYSNLHEVTFSDDSADDGFESEQYTLSDNDMEGRF